MLWVTPFSRGSFSVGEAGPQVGGGRACRLGDASLFDHARHVGEHAPGFAGVLAEAVAPPPAPVRQLEHGLPRARQLQRRFEVLEELGLRRSPLWRR